MFTNKRPALIVTILFFLVLWPVHAFAQGQKKVLDIQEVVSPGGIKAWLVEDHSLPVIAVKFAFRSGGAALDPVDKQGLALMVSNTLDEGAGPYDSQAFQKTLADNSITLRFGSSRDNFSGTLKTLTRNRDLAFDLLRLALNEPRFDEEPVTRMRAANIARIKSALSDPDWIAARLLNDIAFENHPYAKNSGGTLSSLNNITVEDVRQFAATKLARDTLVVSAVGDITPEELGALLDQVFGPLPETAQTGVIPDSTVRNPGEIALYEMQIPQTIIRIMQPGIAHDDPDYPAAQLMNYLLGGSGFTSNLMDEIRETRGLTYGIYTNLYNLDHVKAIMLSTSTKNETAAEVLDLIRQEWREMQEKTVNEQRLEDAKSYMIGALPLQLSSTDSIAGVLLSLQLDNLPIDYLDQRKKKLQAVTPENVQNVAQRLLNPDGLTTVLVGRPENVTPTRKVTELPNVE